MEKPSEAIDQIAKELKANQSLLDSLWHSMDWGQMESIDELKAQVAAIKMFLDQKHPWLS